MALTLPGGKVWIRTWEVQVGRTRLYLLDTNDPANPPSVRAVTSELYGGGPELRLQQEMLLGIAGWRVAARRSESLRCLPPERRPCRLRGAGKGSRVHGRDWPPVS